MSCDTTTEVEALGVATPEVALLVGAIAAGTTASATNAIVKNEEW